MGNWSVGGWVVLIKHIHQSCFHYIGFNNWSFWKLDNERVMRMLERFKWVMSTWKYQNNNKIYFSLCFVNIETIWPRLILLQMFTLDVFVIILDNYISCRVFFIIAVNWNVLSSLLENVLAILGDIVKFTYLYGVFFRTFV